MKSFSESLRITKNMNLAKQCFHLMEENGLNPMDFVDWYCDEGILLERLNEDWQTSLGNTANQFGNWLGQTGQSLGNQWQNLKQTMGNARDQYHAGLGHKSWYREVGTAASALDQLHRRMGVSPTLRNAVGGDQFMQMILQLIQTLRSKKWDQMVAAPVTNSPEISQEAPPPTIPAQDTSMAYAHYEPDQDVSNKLYELQSHGIDPVEFVNWFGKQLNEGLFDGAGEWLGNQWANLSGTAHRWLTGDQRQSWGYDAQKRIQTKDKESVDTAMKALKALETAIQSNGQQINAQFKQTIDEVLAQLKNYPPQQQPQQQQQQQQQQQPQSQQPSNSWDRGMSNMAKQQYGFDPKDMRNTFGVSQENVSWFSN